MGTPKDGCLGRSGFGSQSGPKPNAHRPALGKHPLPFKCGVRISGSWCWTLKGTHLCGHYLKSVQCKVGVLFWNSLSEAQGCDTCFGIAHHLGRVHPPSPMSVSRSPPSTSRSPPSLPRGVWCPPAQRSRRALHDVRQLDGAFLPPPPLAATSTWTPSSNPQVPANPRAPANCRAPANPQAWIRFSRGLVPRGFADVVGRM